MLAGIVGDVVVGPASDAALLLDVDGVLIPYGSPSDEWGEWIGHPVRHDLIVSREMIESVENLPADVHWLTSWAQTANTMLCPFIDWPPKRVLEKRTVRQWWKLVAVEEFLAATSYGRVAWLDDDLDSTPTRSTRG
jgi:hypothetical protein